MNNEIYEVVKEYILLIDGMDFPVKGRVLKQIHTEQPRYKWEISHHCKQTKDAATVYYPSKINAETFKEAEYLLLFYMKPFANIDVVANKYY